MPMVRLLDHGQVTIPKSLREALNLQKGDLAEAELDGERIVITPKKLVRREAWQQLASLLDEVHQQNPEASEQQVTRDVLAAIRQLRQAKYVRSTRTTRRSR
jgi:AbrB family looped-hinge helix DNA binding protein